MVTTFFKKRNNELNLKERIKPPLAQNDTKH